MTTCPSARWRTQKTRVEEEDRSTGRERRQQPLGARRAKKAEEDGRRAEAVDPFAPTQRAGARPEKAPLPFGAPARLWR